MIKPSKRAAIYAFLFLTGEIVCVTATSPGCTVVLTPSLNVVACSAETGLVFELSGGPIEDGGGNERLKSDIGAPDSSRCFNRFNLPSISFAVWQRSSRSFVSASEMM